MGFRHFSRIAETDAAPLAAAVLENDARFKDLTFRQTARGSAHPMTETIFLRMPPEITLDSVFHSLDVVDYPASSIGPLRSAVDTIASVAGGRLARAMVIKLLPGGRIAPHIDQGAYAEATERFHLPILTNERAWLRIGDETVHMPAGSVWWFDKHSLHEGANEGNSPRVHMVVDVFAC